MNRKLVIMVTVTAALSGCAASHVETERPIVVTASPTLEAISPRSPTSSTSSTSQLRPTSSTAIPTMARPSGPPKGPTDQIKITGWVVGTITKDSSGSCYGLETDDGLQYAMYAANGPKLTKGQRIRVKTAPMKVDKYCGPGRAVDLVSWEPLR